MKMNIRKVMTAGLMLCAVLASAAVYTSAYQNQKNNDVAEQAIKFLLNGPTFSFDGIRFSPGGDFVACTPGRAVL